jgi:hypothetical protein
VKNIYMRNAYKRDLGREAAILVDLDFMGE